MTRLFWVLLLLPCCTAEESEEDWLRALSEEIRLHEGSLVSYAGGLRGGKTDREMGCVTYPPPLIPGAKRVQVHAVSMDRNGNVYFVLKESSVTCNVGFIHRVPGQELLGDGMEPRLRRCDPLFGDWWFYVAN